jgi:tetratricopeptide (TPR) repeat protein
VDAYRRRIETQKTLAYQFAERAQYHEQLAWVLVVCPYSELREQDLAVSAARRAVEMEPDNGNHWKTLGGAYYRAGDWPSAVEVLNNSLELRPGAKDTNQFFLAMAHWQLAADPVLSQEERDRHQAQAREFYDRAVEWMSSNRPHVGIEAVQRVRSDAEQLLFGNTNQQAESATTNN